MQDTHRVTPPSAACKGNRCEVTQQMSSVSELLGLLRKATLHSAAPLRVCVCVCVCVCVRVSYAWLNLLSAHKYDIPLAAAHTAPYRHDKQPRQLQSHTCTHTHTHTHTIKRLSHRNGELPELLFRHGHKLSISPPSSLLKLPILRWTLQPSIIKGA